MKSIRQCICRTLAVTGLGFLAAGSPMASPIDQLFSNADGTLQYIQLVDVTPSQLAGMSLVVSYAESAPYRIVFPAGSLLGPPRTDYLLIVSQSLSKRPLFSSGGGVSEWDYVMPDGFLPLNEGFISLGDLDQWNYSRIPVDGASSLFRVGGAGIAIAHSSQHGVVARFDMVDLRFITEYSNAAFSRHFFTAFPTEVAALNSGQIPGWHQIYQDYAGGTGFASYGRRIEAMDREVCRFYLPPPSDSHFFTASPEECAGVQSRYPEFILETSNAFYAGFPDPVTGGCAPGLWPLYRLWNPVGNDHWFSADDQVRSNAVIQGYVSEGYGPLGVGMCVIGTCFGNGC